MSIIMGIDPGLATVGYGLIENNKGKLKCVDYGAIKTKAGLSLEERLLLIQKDMASLIKNYQPKFCGVEELFFTKNVTNGLKVAHARGVILTELYKSGVPIYPFTPLQVKNNITGDGGAQKWQVQEMVKRILNLSKIPKPDDAADALAIAICAEKSGSSLLY